MPTKTIKVIENKYTRQDFGAWRAPYNDGLYAGNTSTNQYSIYLKFNLSAYVNYDITNVYVYVYQFDNPAVDGFNWYYKVASSINADGSVNLASSVEGYAVLNKNNAFDALTIPANAIDAFIQNGYLYIYGKAAGSYASIRPLEYGEAYKAYVLIEYNETPDPQPPAGISEISTITADSKTFSWSAGSDQLYSASELYYQMQISLDEGSTWGETYTTAQGVTSQTVNLRDYLSIEALQYYLNAQAKIRVRTQTPEYEGTTYYSDWLKSSAFTIDYRAGVSIPLSISADLTEVYEGGNIQITIGRPETFNTHDRLGAVMALTYTVYVGSTVLGEIETTVVAETVIETLEVGQITEGKNDLTGNIIVECMDAEGQTSNQLTGSNITVKRFRQPVVVISEIGRDVDSADVNILVSDTGFGGTQEADQVKTVKYRVDEGDWITATLGVWSGLNNAISFAGLTANDRFAVSIKIENVPPTGFAAKESALYTDIVIEFTPAIAILKDPSTGLLFLAAKALLIGEDFQGDITEGDIVALGEKWSNVINYIGLIYQDIENGTLDTTGDFYDTYKSDKGL